MDNRYLPTDKEGFVIDTKSGAILNVDMRKLEAYKKQKKYFESINNDKKRLDDLEKDMSEIKNILQMIAEKVCK